MSDAKKQFQQTDKEKLWQEPNNLLSPLHDSKNVSLVIIGSRQIQKRVEVLCKKLGIKEEELEPKAFESFEERGVPTGLQKLRFERYEAKRVEKLKLLQQMLHNNTGLPDFKKQSQSKKKVLSSSNAFGKLGKLIFLNY